MTIRDAWKKSVGEVEAKQKTERSTTNKFFFARDVALFVSEDLLPFSIVEGTGFRRFLLRKNIVSNESEIPARTTISRSALDDAYEKVKDLVLQELPKDCRYHVSTDTWTDRYRHLPYIAIVIHFLDEKFELKCVPLKTDYFGSPHTGAAILQEIIDTLKEFKLDEKNMFAGISDCASNMVSTFRKHVHIRCADHRMHRALTKDFYETTVGKKVLKLRSRLVEIHSKLLFKKTLITKIAKEKAQEKYLEALSAAEEVERVRSLSESIGNFFFPKFPKTSN